MYDSRSDRAKVRKFYSKEYAWVRRMTRRRDRHAARRAIRQERFDAISQREAPSTQGWISH